MASNIVGTVTITGPALHHVTYETAAWRSTVALDPGTYDVVATNPHTYVELHAIVPGTVIYAYLPSLFGGVAFGSEPQGDKHRDVGRRRDCYVRLSIDECDITADVMAWYWIESPRHIDFNGTGLQVSRQRSLIFTKRVWGHQFRIDPNDGGLPEFTDSVPFLCERVNALQAEGHDPDVWRVTYGDDRLAWFETPVEEHRPNNARKFKGGGYLHGRDAWRYYRDYQPRRAS